MKHLVKYVATILVSVLFFIIGDLVVKGEWLNRIDNSEFVFSHKLGVEKTNPKIILVNIIADGGEILNKKILDGLQIQLMDNEYKELQNATVKNGVVQFDLGSLKNRSKTMYLISPITGNELAINTDLRNFDMPLDMSELNIKQKANNK